MTGIQWTEATWNPIVGCSIGDPTEWPEDLRVREWPARDARRLGQAQHDPATTTEAPR